MNTRLRVLVAMLWLAAAGAPVWCQTKAGESAETAEARKAEADKAAAAKAEAEKVAAAKAEVEKAAAAKAAADKAAADKAAAEKVSAQKAADAQQVSLASKDMYEKSLAALTMLFVLAVLLENAFSVIFNWRVFLSYFSVTGVKTIVMVTASLTIVVFFNLDVLASLIAAYKSPAGGTAVEPASISGAASMFVTALILAGGSAGVNRIMKALGFRNELREEQIVVKPKPTEAWVAVVVKRVKANSTVLVKIKDEGPAAGVEKAPDPIAGVITYNRQRLAGLLMRRTDRFPQNGGYSLLPGHVYTIAVESTDSSGATVTALGEKYVFAPGAIVDLEVKL